MAASHLVTASRALLQVSIPLGSLDTPLPSIRTALISPPRSASPFYGAPRVLPLSPAISTALSPGSAAVCNAVVLEAGTKEETSAAPLSSPSIVQTLAVGVQSNASADLGDAVLVDALTASSAHILGAAVALLNSPAIDASPIEKEHATSGSPVDEQCSQATGDKELGPAVQPIAAVPVSSGGAAPDGDDKAPSEGSRPEEVSNDLPWWLLGQGGAIAHGTPEDATHTSWWARQVEVVRAQERAEEERALQESLQQNKGPDAPYALDGADSLLGAATASSGEKVGARAWWSQLTKIPVQDWLPLAPGAAPQDGGEASPNLIQPAPLETETVENKSPQCKEGRKVQETAGEPITAGEDSDQLGAEDGTSFREKKDTGAEGTAQAPLASSEAGTEPTPLPEHESMAGTRSHIEVTELQTAVTDQDSEQQQTCQEPPKDDDTENVQSTVQQSVDSPIETDFSCASEIEANQSPSPSEINTIASLKEILLGATLATSQPAAAALEAVDVNSPSLVRPTDSPASGLAAGSDAPLLRDPKQALEEARQRLETIKAWRQSRSAPPPQAASALAAQPLLPSLTSQLFLAPSASSSAGGTNLTVASLTMPSHVPRSSVWKRLQQLEWAGKDTSDPFGRTSVAVHLAERHENGGEH